MRAPTASPQSPPAPPRRVYAKRAALIAVVMIALLAAGLQAATWHLQRQLIAVLGPDSEIGDVRIGWGEVVIERVRIRAPQGWPVEDTLRAGRIYIAPDLRSLFGERLLVRRIVFENAYLSILREPGGALRLLPSLVDRRDRNPQSARASAPVLTIGRIELDNAALDLYDRSVRAGRTVQLRLDEVQGGLDDLRVPELDRRSEIQLQAKVRSPAREGSATLDGWLQLSSRDSELDIGLHDVDLVLLAPYLMRESDAGVQRGRVALQVQSAVRNRQLEAPGELVLSDLKLDSGGGVVRSFMGVPRQAVLAALQSGGDELRLRFELKGDLDNPAFSLNETLAVRLTVGMAAALGVEVIDFVKDLGTLGARGLKATGETLGDLIGVDAEKNPREDDDRKR